MRPSPGAATLAVLARAASPETAGSSGNAAPGDGRTPEKSLMVRASLHLTELVLRTQGAYVTLGQLTPALLSKIAPLRKSLDFKAALCLALLVAFQVFAGSNALHRYIHPDSSEPQHSCELTMWTHGQVSLGDGLVPLGLFVALVLFALPPLRLVVLPSVACQLYFSRGPPCG